MPALSSIGLHSIGLPQDDDWSFRHIATHFEQTGHLVFDGWNSMTLVGQIVVSWPALRLLGDHGWVFAGMGGLFGAVTVGAAYVVARHVLTRAGAWGAVLLLLLIPGFGWSTSTFMTDVPALAAELGCLALGLAALGRQGWARWAFLTGALAIGVIGFSIREFAFAAPIAVVLCAAAGDGRRWRVYVGIGFTVIAACGAIYIWSTKIPGNQPSTLARPTHLSVVRVGQIYFEMALLLSPAVVLASWRRLRWALSKQVAVGAVALVVGVGVMHFGLFLGDFLHPQGLFGALVLVGGRPALLPGPVWDLLELVGLVSGALLAALISTVKLVALRNWRSWPVGSPVGLLGVFAALCAAGLAVYGLTVSPFFDRYAWPLVFVIGILLLRDWQQHRDYASSRTPVTVAACFGVLLIAVSTVVTLNANAYSAARWRAGQIAVDHGIRPSWVDAGFEWVGAHAGSDAVPTRRPSAPTFERWYGLMEPGFQECAVVSGSPLDDPVMQLVRTTYYERYGFTGHTPLYVYVSSAPRCQVRGP